MVVLMPKYFVSYRERNGYGRCDITTDKPVRSIKDVERLEADIYASRGVKPSGLAVVGWQRFEEDTAKLDEIIKILEVNASSNEVMANDQDAGYRECIYDLKRLLAKKAG